MALVDLLKHWGVTPNAVIGHSSGEIAAAYAQGTLTARDAWAIAYHRGRLASTIKSDGAMLATGLGLAEAQSYLSHYTSGQAVVGCVNSPSSTTISGDTDAIEEVQAAIARDGHFVRRLKVKVAYHSPHMAAIADKYRQSIAHISPLPKRRDAPTMFSSLSPGLLENEPLGADYWVANMVGQVNFSDGVLALLDSSTNKKPRRRNNNNKTEINGIMVEIGPHSALQGPTNQILSGATDTGAIGIKYQSVLSRGKNAQGTALALAGTLFQLGCPIDISAVNGCPSSLGFLVDLPPFSWNRNRTYWFESHMAKAHRFRKHPRKDLFGSETLESIDCEPRFRNILRVAEIPWAQHHKVQGTVLYPAAGMMIMAIEAMCQKADMNQKIEGYELRDVIIGKALVLPQEDDGVEVMLTLKPSRLGTRVNTSVWQEFQLYSRKEGWELNCSGLIRICYQAASNPAFADENRLLAGEYAQTNHLITEACSRHQNPQQFYESLASIGLQYGAPFRGLVRVKKGDYQSACTVEIKDTRSLMPHGSEYPHVIHPTTLDAIIQMALPSCCAIDDDVSAAMVPVSIGRLYVSAEMPTAPGTQLPGYAHAPTDDASGERAGTIVLSNADWEKPLVIFEGIKSATLANSVADSNSLDLVKLRTKLTSVFHWRHDVSMLGAPEITRLCDEKLGDMGKVDRKVFEELEIASLIYIKRTMGACPEEEAQSMTWNFRLFWQYMKRCHERAQRGELCYQTPESRWLTMSASEEEALLARVSRSSTDGAVLVEHGEHLPQILRGEIPPLQILMRDNFLNNFYQDGLGTERHYAQATFYAELLAHKNPNMRILEIGAGTGGASLPLLQALGGGGADDGTTPRFESYTFTDISVGYFEKARQKLAPWVPYMQFSKLDIEQDPLEQGYEAGSYDLIVASNVLHATRFIGKTLENARKLLKPQGKLLLSEITIPLEQMRFHMIVGSLEGWWYGTCIQDSSFRSFAQAPMYWSVRLWLTCSICRRRRRSPWWANPYLG